MRLMIDGSGSLVIERVITIEDIIGSSGASEIFTPMGIVRRP